MSFSLRAIISGIFWTGPRNPRYSPALSGGISIVPHGCFPEKRFAKRYWNIGKKKVGWVRPMRSRDGAPICVFGDGGIYGMKELRIRAEMLNHLSSAHRTRP
jgi:hypothetical protein